MRSIPTFLVLLVASFLLFCCHESKPIPKYPIEGAVDLNQPVSAAAGVNPNVKHYTCPNNCANSGGEGEGSCPVCGTAYVHNAAYHNNPTPATPGAALPGAAGAASTQVPPVTAPSTPEPPQNAAGVWHYTCSAGCAGGGGGAGSCATCGGALAHNSAYHN